MDPFVPDGFVVPAPPSHPAMHLEPLGPEHNDKDYAAWRSSVAHIQATPGYAGHGWPTDDEFPPERNLEDLRQHATDFAKREGFTYTVLDPATRDVIGCVYIYPPTEDGPPGSDASVRSWVRASHAPLDPDLYALVRDWLARDWPFTAPAYATRG
jgi:hypothetical protein